MLAQFQPRFATRTCRVAPAHMFPRSMDPCAGPMSWAELFRVPTRLLAIL